MNVDASEDWCSVAVSVDVSRAPDLVQGLKPQQVIADKAYDADWLLNYPDSESIEAVIPPRSDRKQLREYDRRAFKGRNDRAIHQPNQGL